MSSLRSSGVFFLSALALGSLKMKTKMNARNVSGSSLISTSLVDCGIGGTLGNNWLLSGTTEGHW